VRRARRARVVVANHALVMIQAALGGVDDYGGQSRDIDRFVAWHARSFTDSLEREIGARLFTGDWNVRR